MGCFSHHKDADWIRVCIHFREISVILRLCCRRQQRLKDAKRDAQRINQKTAEIAAESVAQQQESNEQQDCMQMVEDQELLDHQQFQGSGRDVDWQRRKGEEQKDQNAPVISTLGASKQAASNAAHGGSSNATNGGKSKPCGMYSLKCCQCLAVSCPSWRSTHDSAGLG